MMDLQDPFYTETVVAEVITDVPRVNYIEFSMILIVSRRERPRTR